RSLLQTNSDTPSAFATPSTPRATSVKNGLDASRATYAMVRERPAASCRAEAFGTKPSRAIAASTRARVAGRTEDGWLSTLETVPTDTPARKATSLMLTDVMRPPAVPSTIGVAGRVRPGSKVVQRSTSRVEHLALAGQSPGSGSRRVWLTEPAGTHSCVSGC